MWLLLRCAPPKKVSDLIFRPFWERGIAYWVGLDREYDYSRTVWTQILVTTTEQDTEWGRKTVVTETMVTPGSETDPPDALVDVVQEPIIRETRIVPMVAGASPLAPLAPPTTTTEIRMPIVAGGASGWPIFFFDPNSRGWPTTIPTVVAPVAGLFFSSHLVPQRQQQRQQPAVSVTTSPFHVVGTGSSARAGPTFFFRENKDRQQDQQQEQQQLILFERLQPESKELPRRLRLQKLLFQCAYLLVHAAIDDNDSDRSPSANANNVEAQQLLLPTKERSPLRIRISRGQLVPTELQEDNVPVRSLEEAADLLRNKEKELALWFLHKKSQQRESHHHHLLDSNKKQRREERPMWDRMWRYPALPPKYKTLPTITATTTRPEQVRLHQDTGTHVVSKNTGRALLFDKRDEWLKFPLFPLFPIATTKTELGPGHKGILDKLVQILNRMLYLSSFRGVHAHMRTAIRALRFWLLLSNKNLTKTSFFSPPEQADSDHPDGNVKKKNDNRTVFQQQEQEQEQQRQQQQRQRQEQQGNNQFPACLPSKQEGKQEFQTEKIETIHQLERRENIDFPLDYSELAHLQVLHRIPQRDFYFVQLINVAEGLIEEERARSWIKARRKRLLKKLQIQKYIIGE